MSLTLFHRRFHSGSASLLYYALDPFTSNKTTVGFHQLGFHAFSTDLEAASQQKEENVSEKMYVWKPDS